METVDFLKLRLKHLIEDSAQTFSLHQAVDKEKHSISRLSSWHPSHQSQREKLDAGGDLSVTVGPTHHTFMFSPLWVAFTDSLDTFSRQGVWSSLPNAPILDPSF